jgi:hypothetical protein
MANKNTGSLIRVEFIVSAVILLAILVWGSRSCNRTYTEARAEREQAMRQAYLDSLEQRLAEQEAARAAAEPPPDPGVRADTIRGGSMQIIRERLTPLYSTIDGLNVRKGPGVRFGVVDRLELYEEVAFLNEVTDSTEQINLGSVTPDEPWVKIRTGKGREGWVYGAGVDFYKRKLEGVEN